MGYAFTNVSSPIYGEFYADFGFLSLALGMCILGFSVKWLDVHYARMVEANRSGAGVLLGGVLAGYLIILLRGPLLGVVPGIASLLGVLVVASFLAGRPWAR